MKNINLKDYIHLLILLSVICVLILNMINIELNNNIIILFIFICYSPNLFDKDEN